MLHLFGVNDGMFYESLHDLPSGLKGLGCTLDSGFRDSDVTLIVSLSALKYKTALAICLAELK